MQDGSKQLYMVPKNERGWGWEFDEGQSAREDSACARAVFIHHL